MSSKKSVRFNEEDAKPKKRKRDRPNEDEIDDIDDWQEEDEDDIVPNAVKAKRERRMKEKDRAGDTRIDNTTSLAAEGVEIEPFHMKNDESGGYFDGDTYIFRRGGGDDGGEPDAWLDHLDDDNEKIYQPAATQQPPESSSSSSKNNMDEWSDEDLYAKILPNLGGTEETVLQAISRYANLKKKDDSQLAQDSFNDLTEAASALVLRGKLDVYQMKRLELEKLVSSSKQHEANSASAEQGKDVQWEYQGSMDGKIHGPFSTQEMMNWIQAGYFVGASAVKVRTVRPAESSIQDDLMADLLEDEEQSGQPRIRGEWKQSDQVNFSMLI